MPAAAADMIDWNLAVTLGAKIAGEGPTVTRAEADQAVAELRAGAARSTALVREHTGLDAPENTAPVLVVDRRGWVQANADAFKTVLAPMVGKLTEKNPPSGLTLAVGSRITGAEVGGLLGFLGSKVLGQFDPFHDPAGRLLLVAPNIVHVERELDAVPSDFRLWVCLHEETHRVQFTAVPWMRDHLQGLIGEVSDTVGDGFSLEKVTELLKNRGSGSIIEMLASPEQRDLLDRITAVMSLLEGHADVIMDDVGPSVIPSVEQIRAKFTERRKGIGALDKLLRRLLGLDAKMAQYRDGAVYVRHIVDKVGMADFNAVFAAPENLPTKAEIHDPDAWIARVL